MPSAGANRYFEIWDNEAKLQAWRNSAEFKKAREIGNKLAKFRSFQVDGMPN
jgi:heme-degrading monooxygenase HmoA